MTFPVTDSSNATQQLLTGAETQAAFATIVAALAGVSTAAGVSALAAAIGLTTAATVFQAITPSDTVNVPNVATIKSLYCTVAGNLAMTGAQGSTVTLPVVAGQIIPIAPTKVMATNTTATVIALL